MINAQKVFQANIQQANELGFLYDHLSETLALPQNFDDLLRSQIVNTVSAFDKLMHDLIRIGMVKIFENQRVPTNRYLNEAVSIKHLPALAGGGATPPAISFEEIVREKLSVMSFQDPKKVGEGLSFIWSEEQKWYQIAQGLAMTDKDAKLKLRLIVTRRNAIVHEADLDPVTNQKQGITRMEATDISNFILALGNRIFELVK